jgi:hypothetical protein
MVISRLNRLSTSQRLAVYAGCVVVLLGSWAYSPWGPFRIKPAVPTDHHWFEDTNDVSVELTPIAGIKPPSYVQFVLLVRLSDARLVCPVYRVERPTYGRHGVHGETRRNEPSRAIGENDPELMEFPVSDDISSYVILLCPGQVGEVGSEWFVYEVPATNLRRDGARLMLPDLGEEMALRHHPERDVLTSRSAAAEDSYKKSFD